MAGKATRYKMLIGGEWVESESGERMDVISPADGAVLASVPKGGKKDVDAAVDAARDAFDTGAWAGKPPAERANILWKFASLVEAQAGELAKLESANQGKSLRFARDGDLPLTIDNLKFFAGAARMLEGKSAAEYSGMGTSFIRREPLGVIGAIVPWNYPLLIAAWKIGPALAAGNSLILKPASYTPLTALELGKLAEQAGIPKGVLQIVTGPGEAVGAALPAHKGIDMVAFTGDTATGRNIMESASKTVKRVHLELGGKAPLVVLPDADLFTAADGAVTGGFWNSGQDCTAVTRVLVQKDKADAFAAKMAELARQNFRIGHPLEETTDVGPLVSLKHRERVEGYVTIGAGEGAQVLAGGRQPSGKEFAKGAFYEPTILAKAKQHMRVCREEIFGPVLTVQAYGDLDDAIQQANDVEYGLASSVWGRDINACMKVAARLKFGTVWVNDHGILTSEMPHGGFKQSGFGKDLSIYSFDEYTQVKHVYVDALGTGEKPWHAAVHKMK
jgi:betaine-aldehyde dehydrogenase